MNDSPRYFILVGDRRTWQTSFSKKIWGFSEKTKNLWTNSNVGDFVTFYVTAPKKKIIGFGKIRRKFVEEKIFWPEEKLSDTVLWKYRLNFSIIYLIKDWSNGIPIDKKIVLIQGRKLITKKQFSNLVKNADSEWKTSLYKKIF